MSRNRARAWALSLFVPLLVACSGRSGEMARVVPTKVFEGGGGTLHVKVSLSHPGSLTANFARDEKAEQANAEQQLSPGSHAFAIDLPEKTYGYLELGIPNAPVGARLTWDIRLNGQPVGSEARTLSHALGTNEAFFLQFEFNDLAEVRGAMGSDGGAESESDSDDEE